MSEVLVRLSRAEAAAVRSRIDSGGLERELLLAAGEEALAVVHEAYVLKGTGGTDAAGVWWPPRKTADGRRPPTRTHWSRRVVPARQVQVNPRPIGVRSGRLIVSLEPNSGSADQVLETGPGMVRVGTRVPYAKHFAKLRPIFPPGAWPAEWLSRLTGGIVERLAVLLARAVGG